MIVINSPIHISSILFFLILFRQSTWQSVEAFIEIANSLPQKGLFILILLYGSERHPSCALRIITLFFIRAHCSFCIACCPGLLAFPCYTFLASHEACTHMHAHPVLGYHWSVTDSTWQLTRTLDVIWPGEEIEGLDWWRSVTSVLFIYACRGWSKNKESSLFHHISLNEKEREEERERERRRQKERVRELDRGARYGVSRHVQVSRNDYVSISHEGLTVIYLGLHILAFHLKRTYMHSQATAW